MHHIEHDGTHFNFNGDFSGDVEIRHGGDGLAVPASALKAFVAEWVRRERIAAWESADDDEVLGFPEPVKT